jgi:hypothetical protein
MDLVNYLMVEWNLIEKVSSNQFIFERKSTGKKIFIIVKNFITTEDRLDLTRYYLKGIQPFVARFVNGKFSFEDFMFGGILKWI